MTQTIEKLQINIFSFLKILPIIVGMVIGYLNIMTKLTMLEERIIYGNKKNIKIENRLDKLEDCFHNLQLQVKEKEDKK